MKLIYKGRQKALPAASDRAVFVRVWDVPTSYMQDGFFVSAHGPGEYPPAPACAGADAGLVAALTLTGEDADAGFLAEGARIEE